MLGAQWLGGVRGLLSRVISKIMKVRRVISKVIIIIYPLITLIKVLMTPILQVKLGGLESRAQWFRVQQSRLGVYAFRLV